MKGSISTDLIEMNQKETSNSSKFQVYYIMYHFSDLVFTFIEEVFYFNLNSNVY